ncbi:MAG: hypothetical protein PCFJNLEI_04044 [Verrucomicrobiae bacterium]|nr:hypothetical protein [Verrucomicrobiae bacterium]
MNNIRLTVFDIFSYLIPGLSYLLLIPYALDFGSCPELFYVLRHLSTFSLLAIAVIAYMTGFVSDAIAEAFISRITDKVLGDLKTRVLTNFNTDNPRDALPEYHFASIYSYADVYVPRARDKADQMSAMKGLASNLSLSFMSFALAAGIYSLTSVSQMHLLKTIIEIIAALIISAILMYRADTFKRWSHTHLLNAYVRRNRLRPQTNLPRPEQ